MKNVDLEKLIKEKSVSLIELKENTKYLLVFDTNAISMETAHQLNSEYFNQSLAIGVVGNPDKVFALYKVDEKGL